MGKCNVVNFNAWTDDTFKSVQQAADDEVARHLASREKCGEQFKAMAMGKLEREVRVRRNNRRASLEGMPARWWHRSVTTPDRERYNNRIRAEPHERCELLTMRDRLQEAVLEVDKQLATRPPKQRTSKKSSSSREKARSCAAMQHHRPRSAVVEKPFVPENKNVAPATHRAVLTDSGMQWLPLGQARSHSSGGGGSATQRRRHSSTR